MMTSSTIDHDGTEQMKSAPTKMDSLDAANSDAEISDAEWKEFANRMQIFEPERFKQYLGQSLKPKFLRRFFSSEKATRNLRIAAKLGKTDVVKVLLELGRTNVNNTDKAGQTALHYAAREGHLEIVDMLLAKKNIDASLGDGDGNTALHTAAKHGHVRVFGKILKAPRVDPNSTNDFGETPLVLAAGRGHEKIVDMLLKESEAVGTLEHHESSTPLHAAAENGHADIIKKILPRMDHVKSANGTREQSPFHRATQGAYETGVDTSEKYKSTPLHAAAEHGHADIVKKLLKDVNSTAHSGQKSPLHLDVNSTAHSGQKSPLHLAVEGGHEYVVDLLLAEETVDPSLKDSDGNTPLHIAAEKGDGVIFEKLLQRPEVDVTSSNNRGKTALHVAAKYKHANIVTILLEKPNVDPCAKSTPKDKTPLRMASKFGGVDVVQMLLAKNVDPCLVGDNCGDTPLHLAAKFGHRDVAERLLAVVPHLDMVNKVNKQNETPLFLAAKHGFGNVVDLLLGNPEVDLSICDEHSDSPFHAAVKGGHVDIAEKLFTHPSAVPVYANEENVTGLHLCIKGGYEKLVDMLLKQSPLDANAKDAYGNFPIHYAAQNGNLRILQKILKAPGLDENAVNSINDRLQTPLHIAVRAGYDNVVALLLQVPALDATKRDRDGNSALHVAAKYDEEDMIEKLLKARGVKVNAENAGGVTALVLAAEEGHEFFVNELLKKQDTLRSAEEGQRTPSTTDWGVHSLLRAARNGHDSIVRRLLEHRVNVNGGTHPSVQSAVQGGVQGFRHKTALSEAIEHGRRKVVEVLLDADNIDSDQNIDPNRRNGNGEHPLFIAAKHGHRGIMWMLLKTRQIDVNVLSNGKTALQEAARNGREEVVKLLLKVPYIDVNVLSNGKTALQGAARNGREKVVKLLLEIPDIDVHIKNTHNGKSALFYAARAHNKTILKCIYDVGSEKRTIQTQLSIDDKNYKGESIIHLAARKNLPNVIDFLLEVECNDASSVDVNMKTSPPKGEGLSALQIAIEAQHYKVIEKLMKFDNISFIQEEYGMKFLRHISDDKNRWETFTIVTSAPQVTAYIEALYKDRQASVDAANAILVGAALIAGVTFASWLQPPLGYSTYYHEQFSDSLPAPPVAYPEYATFDHHPSLQAFWVFNSLSFFSAIATVICGARSVLPAKKVFIKKEVEKLQRNLLKTSILLGFSMFFVLLAFATAGVVVLPPLMKFRANIFSTIGIGGSLCFVFLFLFGESIYDLRFIIKSSQKKKKGFFERWVFKPWHISNPFIRSNSAKVV